MRHRYLRPPKPALPCAVCGRPTRAKLGVCWATRECRREWKRIKRRSLGIGPSRAAVPTNDAAVRAAALGTRRTQAAIAERTGETRARVQDSMARQEIKMGWKLPKNTEGNLPLQKTPKGCPVGADTLWEVYREVSANPLLSLADISERIGKSRTLVHNALGWMGARKVWIDTSAAKGL